MTMAEGFDVVHHGSQISTSLDSLLATLMGEGLLRGEAGTRVPGRGFAHFRWAGPLRPEPFSLPSQWLWELNSQYLILLVPPGRQGGHTGGKLS